jgi:hypothetical protein
VSVEKIWMGQMGTLEENIAAVVLYWLHSFPLPCLMYSSCLLAWTFVLITPCFFFFPLLGCFVFIKFGRVSSTSLCAHIRLGETINNPPPPPPFPHCAVSGNFSEPHSAALRRTVWFCSRVWVFDSGKLMSLGALICPSGW